MPTAVIDTKAIAEREVELAARVDELEGNRPRLALAALTDAAARERLEAVDGELVAATRERAHLALARTELGRREAEERARAAEEERQRLEAEAAELERSRDEAVRSVLSIARQLGKAAAKAVELDDAHAATLRALGRSAPRTVRTDIAELAAIALRDVGINSEPIGYVRAIVRRALLERWDTPAVAAPARCLVCDHERREEIDAALADGSLRDAEAKFGIARSTLARHRAHGEAA